MDHESANVGPANDDIKGRRVLVVADVDVDVDLDLTLSLVEKSLVPTGLVVERASNGNDALRQITENPPDLIVLDLMMPGISGFDVCLKLKTDPALARIPIIMLTAPDDSEPDGEPLPIGVDDLVTKPVNPKILCVRVRTHLRLALLARQSESAGRIFGALAVAVAMAHEINNPLQGMMASIELLEARGLEFWPEARPELETIVREAKRIRDVVHRMSNVVEPVFTSYAPGIQMLDVAQSKVRGEPR